MIQSEILCELNDFLAVLCSRRYSTYQVFSWSHQVGLDFLQILWSMSTITSVFRIIKITFFNKSGKWQWYTTVWINKTQMIFAPIFSIKKQGQPDDFFNWPPISLKLPWKRNAFTPFYLVITIQNNDCVKKTLFSNWTHRKSCGDWKTKKKSKKMEKQREKIVCTRVRR